MLFFLLSGFPFVTCGSRGVDRKLSLMSPPVTTLQGRPVNTGSGGACAILGMTLSRAT